VLLNVIGGAGVLALVAFRQRRVAAAAWIAAAGGALVVAAFFWATSVGGDAVEQRFMTIREDGAVQTFQQSRGAFLSSTMGELLDKYPLGAGVGRWGMMNAYFGDPTDLRSPPLYVEIQLTGWLLDGGILMWFFYGGAIVLSVLGVVQKTADPDPEVGYSAFAVLALQVLIGGMAMAGPAFNTQLGIAFWTFSAALHGAHAASAHAAAEEAWQEPEDEVA
jgi:hypothetical protein